MAPEKKTILIVEDSIFMQRMLQRMFENEPDIKVVGIAKDGHEAINKIKELKPTCVTMDINMPRMNGLEVLDYYKGRPPCPIIVLSGFKKSDVELSFLALQKGAYDFILKPSGELSLDINQIKNTILMKIRSIIPGRFIPVKPVMIKKPELTRVSTIKPDKIEIPHIHLLKRRKIQKKLKPGCIVAIGISTGGPNLLTKIIPKFPADFPAPILIAQHMPPVYTAEFAKRLNDISAVSVKEGERGELIKNGTVYIAPGGTHMSVASSRRILIEEPKNTTYTVYVPSATILLSSVAKLCKENCLGVVLTGLGSDGSEGVRDIGEAGGILITQTEETCIVTGMPVSAKNTGFVDEEVPGEEVTEAILTHINARQFSAS